MIHRGYLFAEENLWHSMYLSYSMDNQNADDAQNETT